MFFFLLLLLLQLLISLFIDSRIGSGGRGSRDMIYGLVKNEVSEGVDCCEMSIDWALILDS